jgi:hypothetical protein
VLLINFIVLLEYMKPDKNFSLFLGVSVLATLLLITGMNLSGIVRTTYAQQLGEMFFEEKGKIMEQKEIGPNKAKVSFKSNGTLKGNIEVTNSGNFEGDTKGDATYAQGQGNITTKEGNETASYTFLAVGNMIDGNKSEFRGSSVFNTTSTGKLAFINNLVSVFKVNVDESGNFTNKYWEWN